MDKKESLLAEFTNKLEQISHNSVATKQADVWNRFDTVISKFSQEQMAYVNNSQKAIKKWKDLKEIFSDWLFAKYKNEFVSIPEFEKLAQEYVDTVVSTSQEYIENTKNLQKENEQLKKELEELRAKQCNNPN